MKVAAHSLRFCSAYFGIPYAGAKLDLIALPDFAMGAMENLGAVTFRESVLLVDERAASYFRQLQDRITAVGKEGRLARWWRKLRS